MIEEIKEKLRLHAIWILDNDKGVRADFSEVDLRGVDLRGADLRRATLSGANLRGADLRRATLSGANLRGADLRGTNLSWADLRWTDLSGADLSWADLRWTDLRGANLSWVDLTPMRLGQWEVHIQKESIRIGCQCHPVETWRNFKDEDIDKMHCEALAWWCKHKELIFCTHDTLKGG